MRILSIVLIVLGTAGVSSVSAQDLAETLEEVGRDYARAYVQPLANGLGADMNAGLFQTARVGGGLLPFDLYVGAKVMGALVPDSDKTLSLVYTNEETFTRRGQRYTVPVTYNVTDAPTVFGDTSPGVVTAQVDETFPGPDEQMGTADDVAIDTTLGFELLPGLVDTPVTPFVVPQVGIGSIFGTDVVIRYLPEISYRDIGSVGFTGIGLRHSISQYIPLLPIALSAQVMWQELSIRDAADEEVFSASSLAANVAASKTFLVLTIYGGLQVERSGIDVAYAFTPEDGTPQQIAFELSGDNVFRAIGGAALDLGPFQVNADASLGNHTTVLSAGVGLSL